MALGTAEQQTLASTQGLLRETFSAGGRTFTFRRASVPSSSPAAAELSTRAARDDFGHFARNSVIGIIRNELWGPGRPVWELVDETGTPLLYTSGRNYDWRARASIMFPDQRWLRFLVRGTEKANAIMTAVDQAGNRVAQYRIGSTRSGGLRQAGSCHRQALDLARQIGSSWDEAHALAGLGRCALAAGHTAGAADMLRQALGIFQRIGAAETAEVSVELQALTDARPGTPGS